MKRIIYFLAFGLSVSSFVYIFANTYLAVGISFFVAIAIALICFWVEKKIKNSDGLWARKIMYFFSRNKGDYRIDRLQCNYVCRDNSTFDCEKLITITSKSNNLSYIKEQFWWSAFCSNPVIVAEEEDTIQDLHQEYEWTSYYIKFKKDCAYNEKISTGSKIIGLHDPDRKPAPFFSYVVTKKTKKLTLKVIFPESVKPSSNVAQFKISASEQDIVEPELIQYDEIGNCFSKTIEYPRIGWKYMISWED